MTDLPSGWVSAQLVEVCHVEMGQSPPSSTYNTEGSGLPFLQGKGEFGELYPTPGKFCSHPSKIAKAGAVLLSVRAPVGPTNITPNKCCIGRGLAGISPLGDIPNHFVLWALRHHEPALAKSGTGSTFAAVSKAQVVSIPISLPPLNEQCRIVERIEAQFDEIDRGVESLMTAQRTIELYRQSLLKAAFEGQLTADWRAENPDKLESHENLIARAEDERNEWHRIACEKWTEEVEAWQSAGAMGPRPRQPEKNLPGAALTLEERAMLPRIPEEWVFLRLSDIAAVGSGMSVSKARKPEVPVDVPYLRVANVQRGFLDLGEIKTMQIEMSQTESLGLRRWDVLFNEGGDRDKLGRGWVWECQIPHCITQNHVFRASPFRHDLDWSKYISQWSNSFGRNYFEKGGKQTTNLASINKTVLKALPVPCCSPAEQTEIVQILDDRLEAARILGVEIEAALARAEALRQSILKKAFSGELVQQDPTDEPASALLARIRAERATALGKEHKSRVHT